jgi:hypothetical protein
MDSLKTAVEGKIVSFISGKAVRCLQGVRNAAEWSLEDEEDEDLGMSESKYMSSIQQVISFI